MRGESPDCLEWQGAASPLRYGRRRARVAFALARLWLPLNATRAASPAARTTVPAAYMHMHRRAASGSAWKLSAMNAHSSETEFAADSPLEEAVLSELVSESQIPC